MRAKRWFLFILILGAAIGLGLLYGWVINPPRPQNSDPSTLRSDYKADYVLMVAETFRQEQDINKAAARLAVLGDPEDVAQSAILTSQNLGFAYADVEALARLIQALQAANALPPGGLP